MAPMSGGTSQPNLNTVVEALRFGSRETGLDERGLDEIATYWRAVREFYAAFESQVLPATGDLYQHEMPGGQYTNLYMQAKALGLADRWAEVCRVYAGVNQLFGDIVKVTPTSKAVGDMALFMVANELTNEDVLDEGRDVAFPASVIDLISGAMGQPPGGFPPKVVERILHGKEAYTDRPGKSLEPADFEAARATIAKFKKGEVTRRDAVTHVLYEKVYREFVEHRQKYSDVSCLPTPAFLYGLEPGEEIAVEIEPGKTLIVNFIAVGNPHADGTRTVFFELNGQPREVTVRDLALEPDQKAAAKADPGDPRHVGATMPGMVVTVAVQTGDTVKKGQKLLSLEAMKMETALNADRAGKVVDVLVKAGSQVETGDLLVVVE
jgi:pyruvate carboxylase